ncbi:MAG: peptide ABC transporter substrate-binding protein [Clostridia bacterium]|nr:peptide ABC transporter substrate-binding protein [Clostridia bacterium]
MKNRLFAGLLAVTMLLVLTVSALADTNPNAGQGWYPGTSEKGAITVEITTMSKMNPILQTYSNEFSIDRHIFDNLVKLSPDDNSVVPAAAESWETSEDGLTWTFHLRPGMKWVNSKGEVVADVTAHDFVFGWSELLNPANAAEYYAFATVFKNAQAYYDYASGVEGAPEVKLEDVGFHAVDDLTLVCELETYLPYFLQYVKFEVMAPVYEPFYKEVGADKFGTSPDTLLYNGAFYMTDWVLENSITVQKNTSWWNADAVELQKINFVKYTDTNAMINAFQGGELDVTDITGEQRAMLQAEGYQTINYPGGYSYFFWVNVTDTSDMRSLSLRKAISAAIDRQQIIDTVFKNDNKVSTAMTYGISGVAHESFAEAVVERNGGAGLYAASADPELAKSFLPAALEELGYTDASQIKVTLMTSEGTQNELLSQVVQEQVRKALGVELGIEVLTITESRARRNALQFDMFMGGWGPDYNDPMTDLELFTTTNGNNHTGYSNPEYDALIESTKTELDAAKREQLFVDAEFILQRDLPIIPVYWRYEDYAASEKLVEGFARKPFQALNLIYTKLAK